MISWPVILEDVSRRVSFRVGPESAESPDRTGTMCGVICPDDQEKIRGRVLGGWGTLMSKKESKNLMDRTWTSLTIFGILWVATGVFTYGILDPEERLRPFFEAEIALFGIMIALLIAFTINRQGQQHDFFYQKQIEAAMEYSSVLLRLALVPEDEEESKLNKLQERHDEFLSGSNRFLIVHWGENRLSKPEEIYEFWREVFLEPEIHDEIIKGYLKDVDENNLTFQDVMNGIDVLLIVRDLPMMMVFATLVREQFQESLTEELEKIL